MSGLVIALDNIDRVVEIIKKSADRNVAMEQLMANFFLSERQAAAILDMRLARLTSLEVESLHEEMKSLERLIEDLENILNTPCGTPPPHTPPRAIY